MPLRLSCHWKRFIYPFIRMKAFIIFYLLCIWFHSLNTFRLHTPSFKNRGKTSKQSITMLRENFPSCFYETWGINPDLKNTPDKPEKPIPVTTIEELKRLMSIGYRVQDVEILGNTTNKYKHYTDLFSIPSSSARNTNNVNNEKLLNTSRAPIHPVIKALYERAENNYTFSSSGEKVRVKDGKKIALAIEGGGMRGCVAAGMVTALWRLGLADSVDVVYGSSAGSLIGAYFIAGQLPYFGPEIYYDLLTSAGPEFVDSKSILRSIGFGLLDLRIRSLVDLVTDRMGRPVLNLDYLLTNIVQEMKPLNFTSFEMKQKDQSQVLKVVASGLLSKEPVVFSYQDGNFRSLSELTECMRASMLLPGVTGNVARLKGAVAAGTNIYRTWWREYTSRRDSQLIYGSEPLSDALIFEPVPYRSALKENCTHVLVLRTRADGITVTAKMDVAEKLIMHRFFGRKLGLPELVHWMHNQYHKLIYAEDVLILNEANRDYSEINETENKSSSLFCIAMPPGTPEVKRMETSREAIFNSVRYGFASAFNALVIDPALEDKGWEIAKEIWPDSILDNPPNATMPITTST